MKKRAPTFGCYFIILRCGRILSYPEKVHIKAPVDSKTFFLPRITFTHWIIASLRFKIAGMTPVSPSYCSSEYNRHYGGGRGGEEVLVVVFSHSNTCIVTFVTSLLVLVHGNRVDAIFDREPILQPNELRFTLDHCLCNRIVLEEIGHEI